MAIQLAREMGLTQVCLEGDAKIIVDAVNSREPDWSRSGHLVDDIRTELAAISCWSMVYVCREINQAAHTLARLASMQEETMTWFHEPLNVLT